MSQHIIVPNFPHWAKLTTTTTANPLSATVSGLVVALVLVSLLFIGLIAAPTVFLILRQRRTRRHLEARNFELQEDFERGYPLPTSRAQLEFAE